jgi:peptidoglycan biosynthesis protein MviN/MurJ (putative lipid II flippase)
MDPVILILQLLLAVLAVCVLVWGVRTLTSAWGIGEPLASTMLVAVVIIALLILYLYLPVLHVPRRG